MLLLFQSTLRRTERHRVTYNQSIRQNFNPRSGERSDNRRKSKGVYAMAISIHAPANGATTITKYKSGNTTDFNPRSGERSDALSQRHLRPVAISIHAPANGATKPMISSYSKLSDFNPRSGERSDLDYDVERSHKTISIHAPANGATLSNSK